MVICKACGFVMEKTALGDRCPACGVPAKMFEDYVEKISPRRKFLLALDIHPVLVHFPQAFTASVILLSLAASVCSDALRLKLITAVQVMSALLPFTIVLAMLGGLVDGKIRFRKMTTPLLVRKMVLGLVFLFLSTLAAYYLVLHPELEARDLYILAALNFIGLLVGTRLALMGVSLLNAKFPG